MWLELLKALLYGVVEGITEWLPISSTGHLLLLAERFPFAFSDNSALTDAFWELFLVAVQFGAVCAVAWKYRARLFRPLLFGKAAERCSAAVLWKNILLASLPAAVAGTLGDALLERVTGKDIDGWLFHSSVVAAMLFLYGVVFLFENRICARNNREVWQVRTKTALQLGVFQTLALVPGTSRSGATMLGATLCGVERRTGAEFSFFMALPVMTGACAVKLLQFFRWSVQSAVAVPPVCGGLLLLGAAVAFAVSLTALSFLLSFVRTHSLAWFGWYRILLGGAILLFG